MGKYCPICWSERRVRHAVADIRYWWNYSVLKKPKPDYAEAVKKIIPTMIASMIAVRCIDEVMKSLDDDNSKPKVDDEKVCDSE